MPRKSAADRKADIVGALLVLADRIGPDRLTTTDIAREVGVTQAAIFRHFPTKADLWAAAAEAVAARIEAGWQTAIAANPRPRDRLRALLAVHLGLNETCPAMPAILHSRELAADHAGLRDRFTGIATQFRAHLLEALQATASEGALSPDLDLPEAADLLAALVQGLTLRWGESPRRTSLQADGLRLIDRQLSLFAR
ncbi:MAG: TetR family transcriptional regulator [Rhodobacter sp.]|nr:TetR family transcriptional regulator [Rhodobacter sp.]